ncbi:MAG TPA: transglycosylase domain-containing protein, partial [Rhizomicrobium sp.]
MNDNPEDRPAPDGGIPEAPAQPHETPQERQPWELSGPPDGFTRSAAGPPPDDFEPPGEPPEWRQQTLQTKQEFLTWWRSWRPLRARAVLYGGLSAGALLIVGALAVAIYVWSVTRGLPSVEDLQNYAPAITTRVYAGDGTVLGEYARERRVFVPISFVPKLVINAFTSAEDRNFYNHPGVDPSSILRAALKDIGKVLAGRRPEGASTITQQVAGGFMLDRSQVKIKRKIQEAVLALRLESTYSKEKILELYLNQINLGQNSYGVAAAALNYFGKSLDQLSISEVAFLAAVPKAPSHYDPRFHLQAATDRRNWVIRQMEENGYITREQAAAAAAEPLIANTRPLGSQTEDANYFVEEVRRQLYAKYGEHALYDGGLQVRSSLDTRLQNYAVNALRMGLVRYDRRHGWRGALSNIDVGGDWQTTLKSIGNRSGIGSWRVAAVLGFSPDKSVRIGLS